MIWVTVIHDGVLRIILGMGSANEEQRYIIITLSLIGWAHTQNDPWVLILGTM